MNSVGRHAVGSLRVALSAWNGPHRCGREGYVVGPLRKTPSAGNGSHRCGQVGYAVGPLREGLNQVGGLYR